MFTLVYQGTQVFIRSPLFGNRVAQHTRLQIKRAMSGKLYSYATIFEKRLYTFSFMNLNRTTILEIFNFIKLTDGKDVIIIDHKDQQLIGKILNRPVESQHIGRFNSDFDLLFEGKINV